MPMEKGHNEIGDPLGLFFLADSTSHGDNALNDLLLTLKQLKTHGWVLTTVVTDALVLKHQVTIIYSAD